MRYPTKHFSFKLSTAEKLANQRSYGGREQRDPGTVYYESMNKNTAYFNRKTQIALSLIGLIAAFLALNLKTLNWSFAIIDSPILLSQAILYSPLEYFTSPSKYQYMSFNNLTPWSSLSWDIDYNLFRLSHLAFDFISLFRWPP